MTRKPSTPRPAARVCVNCSEQTARVPHFDPRFCSMRCAATWAYRVHQDEADACPKHGQWFHRYGPEKCMMCHREEQKDAARLTRRRERRMVKEARERGELIKQRTMAIAHARKHRLPVWVYRFSPGCYGFRFAVLPPTEKGELICRFDENGHEILTPSRHRPATGGGTK